MAIYNGLIEEPDGTKYWYLNDIFHREDGPAVEKADGTNTWYLNGKLHREDGPAIEWADGTNTWYLNSIEYTFDNWLNKLDVTDDERLVLALKYA